MKALIASAALVAAIAVAAPASAQTWGGRGFDNRAPYGDVYGRDGFARGPNNGVTEQFARRIDNGYRTGVLTPNEARSLTNRLETIRQLEWRYGRDGYISGSEGRELDRRLAELDRRLQRDTFDNQRNDRYGYGYGRGGYYDNRR